MTHSTFSSRHVNIGHMNICHLKNKIADLNVLLTQPTPFELFGITESWLDENITDDRISIPNFDVFRRDPIRPNQTGIAAYVHHSISQFTKRRTDLESGHVESMWFEIKATKAAPLLVCYVYRHKSETFPWYDSFSEMFDKAKKCSSNILFLGDFNMNLFTSHPSWETTTSNLGLKQLITKATRVQESSETLIDHIYSTNKTRVVGSDVIEVGISDHYAVCCSWALKVDKKYRSKNQHTTIEFRSMKNFNKDLFLQDLSCVPFDNVHRHNDPDEALAEWYSMFLRVLDKHAPVRKKRVKHERMPPWLNNNIIQAMELRDQLKRDKEWAAFRKQRNHVRFLTREAQKSHFQRLIDDKKSITSLWRALNAFTKPQQKPKSTSITAEEFNQHFLSAADQTLRGTAPTASSASATPVISEKLADFCNKKLDPETWFAIPFLTVDGVGKTILQLKNKRSAGHDEISSFILKMALPYIVNSLTYIFNLCISSCKFPSLFKKAKVIPLTKAKTKDLTDPNSFRPISLLSVVSKPLERHIHNNMQEFLEQHELLHHLQSGYRKGHSCHTALIHLVDRWLKAVNDEKMSGAVFLDLRKAFDLVNHNILLKKLSAYQFSENTVGLIQSYLENRTQYVSVGGNKSSEGVIKHGVPQGSILGPLLFSLFINDLPLHISNSSVTLSLFADDGSMDVSAPDVASMTRILQRSLDEVLAWCNVNNMVPNPQKTKCMLITTRQKHQLNPPPLVLNINGSTIDQVTEHKVLGVIIDDRLSWQAHINSVSKTLSKNLHLLSQLTQFTNKEARILFCNAHILPQINYCSTVWDGCSDASLEQLNSQYRRAARLVLDGDTTFINTDDKMYSLGMLPLREHFLYNKLNLMRKVTLGKAPSYILNLITENDTPYETRGNPLHYDTPRIDFCKASFSYSGQYAWNQIPNFLKSITSLSAFRARVHKYLLDK